MLETLERLGWSGVGPETRVAAVFGAACNFSPPKAIGFRRGLTQRSHERPRLTGNPRVVSKRRLAS